jgi:hypothetical protein
MISSFMPGMYAENGFDDNEDGTDVKGISATIKADRDAGEICRNSG